MEIPPKPAHFVRPQPLISGLSTLAQSGDEKALKF